MDQHDVRERLNTRSFPAAQATRSSSKVSILFTACIIGIVTLAFISAQPINLLCSRAEVRGPVDCVKQTHLFWILPLAEEEIHDVRGALVDEEIFYGDDGGPAYRLELLTVNGAIPIRNVYTDDRRPKDEAAQGVNEFVRKGASGVLTVVEPGILSSGNIVLLVIGLIINALLFLLQDFIREIKSGI